MVGLLLDSLGFMGGSHLPGGSMAGVQETDRQLVPAPVHCQINRVGKGLSDMF